MLLPYDGLSPHRWVAALGSGLGEVSTRRLAATSSAAGEGGAHHFELALGEFREAEARFELRTPWDDRPAAVRTLHLRRP